MGGLPVETSIEITLPILPFRTNSQALRKLTGHRLTQNAGAVVCRVADERGLDPTSGEPRLLEREQAQDVVGQSPQPPDPPRRPRPELRCDQVHDLRSGLRTPDGPADGPVRRGAVHGDETADGVLVKPFAQPPQTALVGPRLDQCLQEQGAVLRGVLQQFGSRGLHLGAAEGVDLQVRLVAKKGRDGVAGDGITAGLKRREEKALGIRHRSLEKDTGAVRSRRWTVSVPGCAWSRCGPNRGRGVTPR